MKSTIIIFLVTKDGRERILNKNDFQVPPSNGYLNIIPNTTYLHHRVLLDKVITKQTLQKRRGALRPVED